MPTYLEAFKAAREENPNITISDFDTMLQENPALVTAKPKGITRVERKPLADDHQAEIIEMATEPEERDVVIAPLVEVAPEAEEVVMIMPEAEEVNLDDDEDDGDEPLFHAVTAEIEQAAIMQDVDRIHALRTAFRPPTETVNSLDALKDQEFWSSSTNYQTAQSDAWWKSPAESSSTVTLNLHSSKAYDMAEWYRQIHGLEIGMRWNEEQTKWPFLTRFTHKSKKVTIKFKMPYGSPTLGNRTDGVLAAVRPLLRKDFGVQKVRVQATPDPYYELIPVDETWDARKIRLKKKYLGPFVRKINSTLK